MGRLRTVILPLILASCGTGMDYQPTESIDGRVFREILSGTDCDQDGQRDDVYLAERLALGCEPLNLECPIGRPIRVLAKLRQGKIDTVEYANNAVRVNYEDGTHMKIQRIPEESFLELSNLFNSYESNCAEE